MRVRARVWALVALCAAVAGQAARADEVTLRDGRVLVGRVSDGPDGVLVVSTRYGETTVERADVLRVDRGLTLDDEFEARLARLDRDDAVALEALVAWCRDRGLASRGRQLALDVRRGWAGRDGDAIYEVARWAEGEAYPDRVVERLLREALLADPELQGARVALELREARAALEAQRVAFRLEEARVAADRAWAERERARAEAAREEAEALAARATWREQAAAAREAEAQAYAARARAEAERRAASVLAFGASPRARARRVSDDACRPTPPCDPAPVRRRRDHDRDRSGAVRRPDVIYSNGPARVSRRGASFGPQLVWRR